MVMILMLVFIYCVFKVLDVGLGIVLFDLYSMML